MIGNKAIAVQIAKQVRDSGLTEPDSDEMVTDLIEEKADTAKDFDEIAEYVWNILG